MKEPWLWTEDDKVENAGSFQHVYTEGSAEYGVPGDAAGSFIVPLSLAVYRMAGSSRDGLPVFKDVPLRINRTPITLDLKQSGHGAFFVKWRVRAPRMHEKEGFDLVEVEV